MAGVTANSYILNQQLSGKDRQAAIRDPGETDSINYREAGFNSSSRQKAAPGRGNLAFGLAGTACIDNSVRQPLRYFNRRVFPSLSRCSHRFYGKTLN
jgi:hypothetical protein